MIKFQQSQALNSHFDSFWSILYQNCQIFDKEYFVSNHYFDISLFFRLRLQLPSNSFLQSTILKNLKQTRNTCWSIFSLSYHTCWLAVWFSTSFCYPSLVMKIPKPQLWNWHFKFKNCGIQEWIVTWGLVLDLLDCFCVAS